MVFRIALRDTLPVMMGYLCLGLGAGVMLAVQTAVPYAPVWGAVSAFTILSGTMSVAIVPAMASGASLLSVAALTVAINFRYAFYGFSLIDEWKKVPLCHRLFLIALLADEAYALMSACRFTNPKARLRYDTLVGALDLSYWVVGVTLGCIVGCVLKNFQLPMKGIDFTMTSLFLVIFTDQIRGFIEARKGARR